MRSRASARLLGIVLLALGLAAPAQAAVPAEGKGHNEVNERGDPVWRGEISAELERIVQLVERVVSEREDVFAGSALTSDRMMIEVSATPQASAVVDELRASVGSAFDDRVRIVLVERSMDQLLAAQNEILSNDEVSNSIKAIAPDLPENGLAISALPGGTVGQMAKLTTRLDLILTGSSLSGPPIRVRPGGESEPAATRRNDYSRFYGGGAIKRANGELCSLGFPVSLNGTKYAVTAGHCGDSRFSER